MKLTQRAMATAERIVASLEQQPISYVHYVLTFFFIVQLRFFFESYSTTINYFNLLSARFCYDMLHYGLSFLVLSFYLIAIFHFATKTPVPTVARAVWPGFIVILLTPILDVLFTFGKGADIYYLAPGIKSNVLLVYLTYAIYGGFKGVSLGIQCEVIVALFACYLYFRIKKCSTIVSLGWTWVCYTAIFIWASSPFFIKWFLEITQVSDHFFEIYNSVTMIYFYLLEFFLLGAWLFYRADRTAFLTVIKNIFTGQWLNYSLALVLGSVAAYLIAVADPPYKNFIQYYFVINLVMSVISITFSMGFAALLLKKNHRLAKGVGAKGLNKGGFFLALALSYAAIAGPKVFLILCAFNGVHYFYLAKPLQLQRSKILLPLMLPFNSILLFILGYVLVINNVVFFPFSLIYAYLAIYALLFLINTASKNSFRRARHLHRLMMSLPFND